MDTVTKKERLKLIVNNLKSLVDALESEVYSDPDSYTNSIAFSSPVADYDEMYDDDDGYADESTNFVFIIKNIWKYSY